MIMNKFDWIFFDLDGTLADSLEIMYCAYLEFLTKYGVEGNKDEFIKLNGPSISEIVYFIKKKYKIKKKTNFLIADYKSIIEKYFSKKVKPMKGSTTLLNKLSERGYNMALVTSSTYSIATNFLKKNNWNNFFSFIISSDDVKNSKPDSEIYELCIARTGAIKNKILVVEDSEKGAESATKAGLKCVIINNKQIHLDSLLSIC